MSHTSHRVLQMLADGNSVSGEFIGRRLGISRMAVSKAVRGLVEQGLDIDSAPGRGYRLRAPLQLLDEGAIRSLLDRQGAGQPCHIEILHEVDSTSDYLLSLSGTDGVARRVCLAERQHSGRGRRQRGWHATPYRNITLSIGWHFEDGMATLAGLGIAAGISIVRALHEAGFDSAIGLKWPNDIVYRDRKLGGLLIDVRGEHAGPCLAVLGLGINLSLADSECASIDQPFVTMEDVHGDVIERNHFAALLINALAKLFERYPHTGFAHWREQWQDYDRIAGRQVRVLQGDAAPHGIAEGIDDHGALRVRLDDGQVQHFFSGDVSLRLDDRHGD